MLASSTVLGHRSYTRLVQISDGYSDCEYPVSGNWEERVAAELVVELDKAGITLLGIRSVDGDEFLRLTRVQRLTVGQRLVVFGPDECMERLGGS